MEPTRNASVTRAASAVAFSLAYGAGALITWAVFVLLGWTDLRF